MSGQEMTQVHTNKKKIRHKLLGEIATKVDEENLFREKVSSYKLLLEIITLSFIKS